MGNFTLSGLETLWDGCCELLPYKQMNFIDLNVLIVHIRSQKAADAPSYSLISSVFLLLPMNLAASARQIWRDSQRELSLFLLERYEEK